MLDTGATQAAIADSALARMALQPDANKLVRVQGVAASVLAPVVRVHSLSFGSMHFKEVDLPVLKGPLLSGLDGVLGTQGLDGSQVLVSLLDHHCIIIPSPRLALILRGASAVRLLSQRLPLVSAIIAGVRVQVIIDTGATDTLGNQALLAALRKAGAVRALSESPALLDVTATQSMGLSATTAPLRLGNVSVQPPTVTFADFQVFDHWKLSRRPAMLLGMDTLATLAGFSIDYARLQLQVVPRPAAAG
jgi:predicted aspartyl protease